MEIGIYQNISNTAYHGGEGVSKTHLDAVAKSPAHYMALKTEQRTQTDAFSFGTEAHRLILEPAEKEEFLLRPKTARRSNNDKEEWANWFYSNGADGANITKRPAAEWDNLFYIESGLFLLNQDQIDDIHRMRDAVMAHPSAEQLLTGGIAEQSAYWVDEDTGMLCRCRPDYHIGSALVDLKTTKDASPREFGRSAANLRYHVQAAFYLDGMNKAGADVNVFGFIAVEKTAPYNVAVYTAEESHIEKGRELYKRDLEALAEAKETGKYTGYSDEPMPLFIPQWALD